MKFCMKFNKIWNMTSERSFFQNHAENETGRLVRDLFLLFKKALYKVKASGHHLNFNRFW